MLCFILPFIVVGLILLHSAWTLSSKLETKEIGPHYLMLTFRYKRNMAGLLTLLFSGSLVFSYVLFDTSPGELYNFGGVISLVGLFISLGFFISYQVVVFRFGREFMRTKSENLLPAFKAGKFVVGGLTFLFFVLFFGFALSSGVSGLSGEGALGMIITSIAFFFCLGSLLCLQMTSCVVYKVEARGSI